MAIASTEREELAEETSPPSRFAFARHLNRQLVAGLIILVAAILVALIVPATWRYGPTQIVPQDSLQSPNWNHIFGSDDLGRDVFVRVADGFRISLTVAIGSILLATLIGVPLGIIAGYFGRFLDAVIMRPLDVFMAFPAILLAIVVTAVMGPSVVSVTLAIGLVYAPVLARVMRASTLVVRRELYVHAARARGASHTRVLLIHVLPNAIGPVIVQASILMGIAILVEAALSFVGLGVRPPTPSLGLMLSDGQNFLSEAPWMMIAPGACIILLVLSFNLIGDGLQTWLDPKGRARLR